MVGNLVGIFCIWDIFLIIIWQIIKRYKQLVEKNNDIIIQENIQAGKKDYFTNISQGLITPLMTISTIADNIQSSDTSTQKKMGIIQENVNRLKGMMQQEMKTQLHITKIDEHFIEKATKIVEQYLGDEKLDVVFLASELGMSRSTFSRKLKAVIHQTPLEFIRSIKMKHAAEMLKQKTASIQDVMQTIGYNDHKTFTQVFRDTFGMTPSEYQRDSK
jgi:AraC-like DNA-binding protein